MNTQYRNLSTRLEGIRKQLREENNQKKNEKKNLINESEKVEKDEAVPLKSAHYMQYNTAK